MELPRPLWLVFGLVLAANSVPVNYITLPASTYPLPPQGNPFYYLSNPLSRTAAVPQESETSLKYVTLSHPEANPNQRYVIAPYSSYEGLLPFGRAQIAGLGPQGYPSGLSRQGFLNNEYVVYPSMTDTVVARQGGPLGSLVNYFQQQLQNFQLPNFLRPRPEKPEKPEDSQGPNIPEGPTGGSAPLPPFSEGLSGQNPAPEENEGLDNINPDESAAPPAESAETASKPEETPEKPEETPEKPEEAPEKPEEAPAKPEEATEEKPETPMEEANAEVFPETPAEMASESRLFARSRAFPGREGEGEMEEVVGEQEEEEEDKEEEAEEDKEEDDSVVIGPGSANPSIAQAKPAAIALAGMGGVAAAAPTATAVVGANGLAISAPSATAVAGPSAGSAPPGVFPKGTKLKYVKVTPEEARINAAKIQAARQSAFDAITDLRLAGQLSFPYFGYRF